MLTETRPCPRLDLAAPDVDEVTALAAILADRTRAGILALLRDGPHCVCEFAATFGERENNVSNHLTKLRARRSRPRQSARGGCPPRLLRARRRGHRGRTVGAARGARMTVAAIAILHQAPLIPSLPVVGRIEQV